MTEDFFSSGKSGFTLMEMLVVIMILGMFLGMVMPFANRMDDDARRKQTENSFEEVRLAILGPRNAFDQGGNRRIGGYAGDVGCLPELRVMKWNDGWLFPDSDLDSLPDVSSSINGDDFAQPVALWRDRLDGYPHPIAGSGWKGPYMAEPRDMFPDDQVREYIPAPGNAEEVHNNRSFLLRETDGRLSDGWGRAFFVYANDADNDGNPDLDGDGHPLGLVFVSAGPDGRYSPSDPADTTLADNDDNLVFRITRNEWDNPYDPGKISRTEEQLERLKRGVIGYDRESPSGFIADIGNPDSLCGSVVRYGTSGPHAYRCRKTHCSATGNRPLTGGNEFWDDLGTAGADCLAPDWEKDSMYFKSTPQLLQVYADHVLFGGSCYRCRESHLSAAPFDTDKWEEVSPCAFRVPEWEPGRIYYNYEKDVSGRPMIGSWKCHRNCRMWTGWRGPYIPPEKRIPFVDAWGKEIAFSLDAKRNIIISSGGGDGNMTTLEDNLEAVVYRTEYEVPVDVYVYDDDASDAPVDVSDLDPSSGAGDMVDVYVPYNGHLRMRRAWAANGTHGNGPPGTGSGSGPVVSTLFPFSDAVTATGTLAPAAPEKWNGEYAPVRSETASTPATACPAGSRYARAFLPVGPRWFVYRDDAFGSASGDRYGSPSCINDPASADYAVCGGHTSRPGYQGLFTIYPLPCGNAPVILGQ